MKGDPSNKQFSLPCWPGTQPPPIGWEVRRLKFAATCNDEVLSERTDPDYEIAYVDISSVNLVNGITAIETLSFEEAPSRARRIVRDGDTIISTVRTYLRAIAAIEQPPDNMIVSTGFAVVRPMEFVHSRYLGYALQSTGFIDAVVANSTGVSYPAINPTTLVCLPFAYPKDKKEQQQLATFLDWKTGQIDALIARKQELLEKLKEKRIAVITEAVTRGLNAAAPLRDSGIPWFGQVPEHWEVCQIKRKFASTDYGISDSLEPEGAIAVLRMGNIVNGTVVLDDLKFVDDVPPNLVLRKGDLLYNRTNSLDLIGKVGMFTGNSDHAVSFASYLVRIRTEPSCLPEYFAYLLNTEGMLGVARSNALIAIGQCNLNPNRYGQIRAAIPPRAEQESIVAYLDSETAKLDELAEKTNTAISSLAEYRTALITAGTTGKIDVRNLKIPEHVA